MSTPTERLALIARWSQRADDELEYAPDGEDAHGWTLHEVPFVGEIVSMVVVDEVLYLSVITDAGQEYWATTDGETYTQPTPAHLMAVVRSLIPNQASPPPRAAPAATDGEIEITVHALDGTSRQEYRVVESIDHATGQYHVGRHAHEEEHYTVGSSVPMLVEQPEWLR